MTPSTLSIITITCRPEPRLDVMAAAIQDAIANSQWDDVEWIIVDERMWGADEDDGHTLSFINDIECSTEGGAPFTVRRVPPKKTPFRGPGRAEAGRDEDLPAANSARNTGLAIAEGDYIVFLDDCQLITGGSLAFAKMCADRGTGMRLGITARKNFRPRGTIGQPIGNQRPLPTKDRSIAGGGFGAPHWAFDAIGGFDEAYDGEHAYEDKDAILRMTRAGLSWLMHPAAKAFVLPETHTPIQSGRVNPARNRVFFRELGEDAARVIPRGAVANFPAIVSEVASSVIVVDAGEVARAPEIEPGDHSPGGGESGDGEIAPVDDGADGAVSTAADDVPTSEHRPPGVPVAGGPAESADGAGGAPGTDPETT